MDAISTGMNSVPRDLMRPADVRQAQAAQQQAQAQARRAEDAAGAEAAASRPEQASSVVTLSTAPRADSGTVQGRAVEQARAAAANGDVRNNYSAQRALASYEAMAQVGAAARPAAQEPPVAPGQQKPGVLRA